MLRFVDDVFSDSVSPTVGVDFKVKTWNMGANKIKLQIWDTAGQERFRNIVSSYFRGAHGILIVYDVTNPDALSQIQKWLQEVQKFASESVKILLVGNKSDLQEESKVNQEIQDFAQNNGIPLIHTSAKTGKGVKEAFFEISKNITVASLDAGNLKEIEAVRSVQMKDVEPLISDCHILENAIIS